MKIAGCNKLMYYCLWLVIGHILTLAPFVNDLYFLVRNRSYQWHDIGRELGLPFGYREGLKREGVMTSDETKLECVIMKWEQSQCSDVTWSNVINVLKILQFDDLVESTRAFLKRPDVLKKYSESGNH